MPISSSKSKKLLLDEKQRGLGQGRHQQAGVGRGGHRGRIGRQWAAVPVADLPFEQVPRRDQGPVRIAALGHIDAQSVRHPAGGGPARAQGNVVVEQAEQMTGTGRRQGIEQGGHPFAGGMVDGVDQPIGGEPVSVFTAAVRRSMY